MACWSENYHFIKEVYDFRVEEMNKWMDALEESSKKLITNKVYTSREFRRMRDQFRYQCKNLRREELKQWLHEMLKLLNQKSDQNLETEKKRLEALIQRHTEVLPGIEENMRKVDVYSRCYQYVDDITPLLKLLEDLRRKSTEDEHDKKPDQGGIKVNKCSFSCMYCYLSVTRKYRIFARNRCNIFLRRGRFYCVGIILLHGVLFL
ncbi:hypothetical protein FJT64_007126 [Amphibalanus amphitrite]|uniref:Uncharacterized protein n=1 Tax=Amphibalanus amphitrite TaxID=1232801 RepID=A0A6A4VFW0_AMPAM|nr:hypothetical protein FJT64_007126 [Amphibalanus amphitrite]